MTALEGGGRSPYWKVPIGEGWMEAFTGREFVKGGRNSAGGKGRVGSLQSSQKERGIYACDRLEKNPNTHR